MTTPAVLGGRHDSTPDEARRRADRLRIGIVRYAEMRQDIADTYTCRDWLALGYENWPAYVEAEFGEQLAQLTRDERRQVIGDLRKRGMSTRQIASTTGTPQSTVSDKLRQLTEAGQLTQPERITGSDGRKRRATRTQTPARRDPAGAARAPVVATAGGPDQTPGPADAADCPPAGPGTTAPGGTCSGGKSLPVEVGATPAISGQLSQLSDGEALKLQALALEAAVWRLLSSDPRKAVTVGTLGCRLDGDADSSAIRAALTGMLHAEYARTVCAAGPDGREWWWRAMPSAAFETAAGGSRVTPADGMAAAGLEGRPAAAAPAPRRCPCPAGGVIPLSGEYGQLLAEVVAGAPAERVDEFERLLDDAVQAHRPWASEVDRACRRLGLAQEIARYEAHTTRDAA
jgi:hypothetical protein